MNAVWLRKKNITWNHKNSYFFILQREKGNQSKYSESACHNARLNYLLIENASDEPHGNKGERENIVLRQNKADGLQEVG